MTGNHANRSIASHVFSCHRFGHTPGTERMQLALFEPSRLAHRPYCTDDKTAGLAVRGAVSALKRKYVQANCPALLFRLVLDVDHNIRSTAELHSWAGDFQAPQPNWTAITRETGRGHLGYEIEVPVATHDYARSGPIRLAAAIEDGLTDLLRADASYAGLICKNPLHVDWHTVAGRVRPYDLSELSEWVDLTQYQGKHAKAPRGSLGRNCLLFDRLRRWSYKNLRDFKGKTPIESWYAAVEAQGVEFNHFHQADLVRKDPLAWAEVKATAKSVAKWTWVHFGEGKAHLDFIDTQRHKQGLQAASKRAEREGHIRAAHAILLAAGGRITVSLLAKRSGVSRQSVYKDYAGVLNELGLGAKCQLGQIR